METPIQWKSIATNQYALLYVDQPNLKAVLTCDLTKHSFTLEVNGKIYRMLRKGFWSQTLQWVDDLDFVVVELKQENTFVGKYSLQYADEFYQLEFANLPLVTLQLYQSDTLLAAYGLGVEDQRVQFVMRSSGTTAPLLEATLFALMYPYALENIGFQAMNVIGI